MNKEEILLCRKCMSMTNHIIVKGLYECQKCKVDTKNELYEEVKE